jgi:hypothetical protein
MKLTFDCIIIKLKKKKVLMLPQNLQEDAEIQNPKLYGIFLGIDRQDRAG